MGQWGGGGRRGEWKWVSGRGVCVGGGGGKRESCSSVKRAHPALITACRRPGTRRTRRRKEWSSGPGWQREKECRKVSVPQCGTISFPACCLDGLVLVIGVLSAAR